MPDKTYTWADDKRSNRDEIDRLLSNDISVFKAGRVNKALRQTTHD